MMLVNYELFVVSLQGLKHQKYENSINRLRQDG